MGIPFQVLTVLVVDDLHLARRIAVRILSEEGFGCWRQTARRKRWKF